MAVSKIDFKEEYDAILLRGVSKNFDEAWEIIMQGGVGKIVSFYADNLRPKDKILTTNEYINIYSTMYCFCTQKISIGSELYSGYKTLLQQYVDTKVLPAVRGKESSGSRELVLREVVKAFRSYKIVSRWLSRMFHHLDRPFIIRRSYPKLDDVALHIFQEQVYDKFKEKILSTISTMIREDRDGYLSDRALIKEVLEAVYDLKSQTARLLYQIDFEPGFLDSSREYYRLKFETWSQTLSSDEYMSKVAECMYAERSRAKQCMYQSTVNKLLEAIVPADLRNLDGSPVICLYRRFEQLEQLGTNNSFPATDQELTMEDADGCLPGTSEQSMNT